MGKILYARLRNREWDSKGEDGDGGLLKSSEVK